MGSDDSSTCYAARLNADGKLEAATKGTQSGFQAEVAAAANDGLYILNTGSMQRWTCK